jgi:hypothetical protein
MKLFPNLPLSLASHILPAYADDLSGSAWRLWLDQEMAVREVSPIMTRKSAPPLASSLMARAGLCFTACRSWGAAFSRTNLPSTPLSADACWKMRRGHNLIWETSKLLHFQMDT